MEGAERDRALIFSPSAAAARTGALANLFGCTSSLGSSRSGYPNPPMHTPPTHREEWQNPKLINDREMERSLCHPHLLAGNQFFIFGAGLHLPAAWIRDRSSRAKPAMAAGQRWRRRRRLAARFGMLSKDKRERSTLRSRWWSC